MLDAEPGTGPGVLSLQCFNIEVAVMLAVTSKITQSTHLLEQGLVGASFRPRLFEIVGILRSFQTNGFRIGPHITVLSKFEKEIQDHLKTGKELLAYASET